MRGAARRDSGGKRGKREWAHRGTAELGARARTLRHALGHDRQRVGEVTADNLGRLRVGGKEEAKVAQPGSGSRQQAALGARARRTIKTKQKPMAQSSCSRARLFLARSAACVAAACSMASSRLADAAPPPDGRAASLGDASKLSPKEPDIAQLRGGARKLRAGPGARN